jgi:2-hydroxy-6-oxonona-2,4-dienedioate hydrolase
MRSLGRDRALISGESLGGWVATYLAVHHPAKVERIVLNTAGGWTAHPEVMERLKKLSTAAVANPSSANIRSRIEFLMFDKSLVSDDLVETRRAIYAQLGFADVMERILCLQDMDIRRRNMISENQYRSIKAPALVIWTSHDPTATPEEGKRIAEMISGARYVVMNQCGHWPQYENADLFNQLQIAFLRGKSLPPVGSAQVSRQFVAFDGEQSA